MRLQARDDTDGEVALAIPERWGRLRIMSSMNQQPLGRGLLIRTTIEASHQALIDHRVRDFHEARDVGSFNIVDIARCV